jgi:hypothetical protein
MTLSELKSKFKIFRASRDHRGTPFPDHYWKEAARLIRKHDEFIVRREINITKQQINRYCLKYLESTPAVISSNMVELNDKPEDNNDLNMQVGFDHQELCNLELRCGDKILALKTPISSLGVVLPLFSSLLAS